MDSVRKNGLKQNDERGDSSGRNFEISCFFVFSAVCLDFAKNGTEFAFKYSIKGFGLDLRENETVSGDMFIGGL